MAHPLWQMAAGIRSGGGGAAEAGVMDADVTHARYQTVLAPPLCSNRSRWLGWCQGGGTGQQTDGFWDIGVLLRRTLRALFTTTAMTLSWGATALKRMLFSLTVSSCAAGLTRKAAAAAPETVFAAALSKRTFFPPTKRPNRTTNVSAFQREVYILNLRPATMRLLLKTPQDFALQLSQRPMKTVLLSKDKQPEM